MGSKVPALAAAWGVSYGTDAKAVWFRMGLPGGPASARGAGTEALDAIVPAGPWNVTTAQASTLPPAAVAEISMPGESGYDMLLGRCVASAREIASADSAILGAIDELRDLDRDAVRRQRWDKFLAIGRTLG